jgi:hypothetical protein
MLANGMSLHPFSSTLRAWLLRSTLLAGLLLSPAVPAVPAVAAPSPQLSDMVWVLQEGYPLVDQDKVPVPAPQPSATHSVQLSATGLVHRKVGRWSDTPYEVTHTFNFPATPRELVPGQTFNPTASLGITIGAGKNLSYRAMLQTSWDFFLTPKGEQSPTFFTSAGQSCPSSGGPA